MGGDAFNELVPWTRDSWLPASFRFPTLDLGALLPVMFGMTPGWLAQVLVAMLAMVACDRLWFYGTIQHCALPCADQEQAAACPCAPLSGKLPQGAKVVEISLVLASVVMIPCARVTDELYLGCDYEAAGAAAAARGRHVHR